jgi:SAM-dependent methyltransferase
MATTPGTPAPSPIRIFQTLRAYQESAALKSAIDLGIFTAIADGAVSAASIASACGASERGIRILCDTLTVSGMLGKHGGRYANTPDTGIFLNRHSPAYLGSVADFLLLQETTAGFLESLTGCVRKGGTLMQGEGSVDPDNPEWVVFAHAMAPLMKMPAGMMAQHLPGSGPLKVLDIAAGHGMFGIAVAQRNPQAEIVAVDWAAVLEVAKENAANAGISARYSTIPGSAFDVDFGSGFDAVLITNFLHHFDAATNERLLRKVHSSLKPGGNAVILEFVPDEDRVSPPVAAHFAITMLVNTPHGDAFTFSEIESMCRHAGFASNVQHLLETQQSVIISTK